MRKFCYLATLLVAGALTGAADSPYGFCSHVTRWEFDARERTFAQVRETGFGWVRTDFDWSTVEPKQGVWDFAKFDTVVADAEKAGIQLLPILGYTRPWADPAHRNLSAWREYVRRLLTRYAGRFPVVEVWNEENGDPAAYVAILRAAYETAKAVDPKIRVAIGGFAGVPFDFIEKLYAAGARSYFDIMNIHPYCQPKRPELGKERQFVRLRELMARQGDGDKPVWVTEIGWPTPAAQFAAPGMVRAGLRALAPARASWRVLYIDQAFRGDPADSVGDLLRAELPAPGMVEACLMEDVARRLRGADRPDVLVMPFTENYPEEASDDIVSFVRDGGIVVDCHRMAFWSPLCRDGAEGWRDSPRGGAEIRKALRISSEAFWTNKALTEFLPVAPTSVAAPDVRMPPSGLTSTCFYTPKALRPGDTFFPLMSGRATNGYEAVSSYAVKFGDMKGGLVISGLPEGAVATTSPDRQARLFARMAGIHFACGVERWFWYSFRNVERDRLDPESHFGVFRHDFSPKPAAHAARTFAAWRPVGSEQLKRPLLPTGSDLYRSVWRRGDGTVAGLLWTTSADAPRRVAFTGTNMTFCGHLGEPAQVSATADPRVYELVVGESPVYFSGGEPADAPAADAVNLARAQENEKDVGGDGPGRRRVRAAAGDCQVGSGDFIVLEFVGREEAVF